MRRLFPLYPIVTTLFALTATAQTERVGINTRTPASTLDVKANNTSTPLQYWRNPLSDILVSILSSGNVGIGTATPAAKLEVRSTTQGGVKIVDGTQGIGKVLTCDASGVGTWQSARTDIVLGVLGAGVNIPANANRWYYTGSNITLPPGKWLVNVTMVFGLSDQRNYNVWLRSTFQDDTSATTLSGGVTKRSADINTNAFLICGQLVSSTSATGAILTGCVLVNNTSAGNKTYYYVGGHTVVTGGTYTPKDINKFGNNMSGENIMYAIRVG